MTFDEIRKFPTVIKEISPGSSDIHESCFRSYHVLSKVISILEDGLSTTIPRGLLLELIEMMSSRLPTQEE